MTIHQKMSDRMPEHLRAITDEDYEALLEAAISYGDSWKRRGGVGAFMMLARKWDRLEVALNPDSVPGDMREAPISARLNAPIPAFDIFAALAADDRPEGLIDDIRDLRRYLILVEAEMRRRGAASALSGACYTEHVQANTPRQGERDLREGTGVAADGAGVIHTGRIRDEAPDTVPAPRGQPYADPDIVADPRPDTERGLYKKYEVRRLDGKHPDAHFFVLRFGSTCPNTDAAFKAYVESCEKDFPHLAEDIRTRHWDDAVCADHD